MKNKGNSSSSLMLGEVISPNPLTIRVGEIQLSSSDLLVADDLISGYKRTVKIPTTLASGSTSQGSISSISIPDAEITFTNGLSAGDVLAVYPINDNQLYVILSRVVKV